MDFLSQYSGVFIVGGLIILYITTYTLNKRTPVPEDCLSDAEKVACKSCNNFACSHKG